LLNFARPSSAANSRWILGDSTVGQTGKESIVAEASKLWQDLTVLTIVPASG
jgi:hypothetical protein